jgi:cell division protease FtsH
MEQNNNSKRKIGANRKWIIAAVISVVFIAAGLTVTILIPRPEQIESISLSKAAAAIRDGKVSRIEDSLNSNFYLFYLDGTKVKGVRDPGSSLLEQLSLLGLSGNELARLEFEITHSGGVANPMGIMFAVAIFAFLGIVLFRSRRSDRFGQKNYKESEIPNVQFSDVAGIDENLQELQDIVTFLKEGNKYSELGAHMPRGVLMVGDPGTGKTLVAKAVAGEAGVPFFATSGSEFTEIFVGVGASRMRSLFKKARQKAPCIIFIDEIDAVGRSRHRSESGAEMEQDQTLNQLLVEMDGFDSSAGVVVLAATNRVDVLDSALTRPGRFDRQVYVNPPDVRGREAILNIHSRGKKLAPSVNLAVIAKATPGLVGSDLANIINEAAISAVRRNHTEIEMYDFEEAIEKILAGGVQRKNQVMSTEEKEIIAYHEAGHAVVMNQTRLSDPVHKITIIPRGKAGGYTMALPEEDRILISRARILARITGLLGGRAAEEIFFQDITSGASNDLVVATKLAEDMVMRLGMERKAGLRVFSENRSVLLAPQGSQKTYENLDEAVHNILETCYEEARSILLEKRDKVDLVAHELLEVETIDKIEFNRLMETETGALKCC